jgi:transcriptional regulator with XRE-family HTH domain
MSAASRRRAKLAMRAAQERQPDGPAAHTPHLALVAPRSADQDGRPEIGATAAPHLAFCARLRATRERQGITLGSLAESTKVAASHFAALERGDLSHWPEGVYKRAFFRAYASGIGLPPESTLEDFLRAFPDEYTAPAITADARETPAPDAHRPAPAPTGCAATRHRLARRTALDTLLALIAATVLISRVEGDVATGLGLFAIGAFPQLARAGRAYVRRGRAGRRRR